VIVGTDALVGMKIAADLAIAAGYVSLGALLTLKLDAAAPTRMLLAFKLAGLVFFLLCAYAQADLAWHDWSRAPYDVYALNAVLIHAGQAIAAAIASVIGWSFISLRIYDRKVYSGLLDREIDRQAHQVAAQVRSYDVGSLAVEARRVADAAELIRAAYDGRRGSHAG
jgi:hypothetical protein